jgi:two-component system cell cycle response regulator
MKKPYNVTSGLCYLVKEKKPEVSFRIFKMIMEDGLPGLCVTRLHPERARKEFGLGDTRIIWLCHTPGEDYHDPTALGTLLKVISKFIQDNEECVVLFDGFEYLMINNGFLQSLLFLENLNEFVMQNKAIVLIPVCPDTLDEKELALLERDVQIIETLTVERGLESTKLTKLLDNY